MDVHDLLYKGIGVIRRKENLTSFLIREFKKAERNDFYTIEDFFDPLFRRIEKLNDDLAKDFDSKKKGFEETIKKASKNELEFYESYIRERLNEKGKEYRDYKEEQNNLWLKDLKTQLANLDISMAQTPLLFTKVSHAEVLSLEMGVQEARASVTSMDIKSSNISIIIERIGPLRTIWLAEPKISIPDFLEKGKNMGLWDDELRLITQKGSLYGSGKTLLSNIFTAMKGYAIHSHTDYKKAGEIFCSVFKINNKETIKEPYKVFGSANPKQTQEIKRAFNIR